MAVDTSIIIIASFLFGACCSEYAILCTVILILIGGYLGYKLREWRRSKLIASFLVGVCFSGYDIIGAVISISIGYCLGYKLKECQLRHLRHRRNELFRDLRRVRNEMNVLQGVNN